jgi:hypothetical protein
MTIIWSQNDLIPYDISPQLQQCSIVTTISFSGHRDSSGHITMACDGTTGINRSLATTPPTDADKDFGEYVDPGSLSWFQVVDRNSSFKE